MVAGTILSAVAILVAIYASGFLTGFNTGSFNPMLAVALFVFGFGTGSFMLGFALGKEMNTLVLAATVIAIINIGDAIFGAFTEPLIGKLLDTFWQGKVVAGVHYFSVHDYHLVFILLPVYLLVAILFALPLRK